MLGDWVHPCGGVFSSQPESRAIAGKHQSLPRRRWAGWAKAVTANQLRNLEAEELHCFSCWGTALSLHMESSKMPPWHFWPHGLCRAHSVPLFCVRMYDSSLFSAKWKWEKNHRTQGPTMGRKWDSLASSCFSEAVEILVVSRFSWLRGWVHVHELLQLCRAFYGMTVPHGHWLSEWRAVAVNQSFSLLNSLWI